MFLGFVFSCCFSLSYSVYWLLGMLGVPVSNRKLSIRFDSYGKISSMVNIILSLTMTLTLLLYAFYLKLKLNLTKEQITNTILSNHKKKILGFEFTNLLVAISILASILSQAIQQQQDFIMIHSLILCTVSLTRLYKALKLYTNFHNSTCLQLLYFSSLSGLYAFLLYLDFSLNGSRLAKDDTCLSLALNTELLYLELMLSAEKALVQAVLKVIQYGFVVRAGLIYAGSGEGGDGRASLEEVISIGMWCLVVVIWLKDVILVGVWVRGRVGEWRRGEDQGKRGKVMQVYLRERAAQQQKIMGNQTQEELQGSTCSICLEANDMESVRLECPHTFHINCAIQWLKRIPKCPLCHAEVVAEQV